jgi:hypothetical protein
LSFEIVRLDNEWFKGVGTLEGEEFTVEEDFVPLSLDALSLEELSLWKLAFERRLKSLKKGMKTGCRCGYETEIAQPSKPCSKRQEYRYRVGLRHDKQSCQNGKSTKVDS